MIGRAVLALVLALVPLSAPGEDQALHVLAAGSLAGALGDIARTCSAQTGVNIEIAFGPSGGMLERIEKGEPADIFAYRQYGASADIVAREPLRPGGAFRAQTGCAP
jgi:molybdate transport system substrate-binding protein